MRAGVDVEEGDHAIFVGKVVDASVAAEPAGRADDATLWLKDLGEKVFYAGLAACPLRSRPVFRWPPIDSSSRARFGFAEVRELVPYLHDLGISDCYFSPFLMTTSRRFPRLRHRRPQPAQPGPRLRGRLSGAHVCPPGAWHGADRRRRPEPHGHRRQPQRVVAGHPRARARLAVQRLLRHRLGAPRAGAARGAPADPRRSVRRGAREPGADPRAPRRGVHRSLLRHRAARRPQNLRPDSRLRRDELEASWARTIRIWLELHSIVTALSHLPARTDRMRIAAPSAPANAGHQAPPGRPAAEAA